MSPFKSAAQRRLFGHKVQTGEISQKTFNEFNAETGNKKLPEHVKKKPTPKKIPKK